jgi:hypothetical protein
MVCSRSGRKWVIGSSLRRIEMPFKSKAQRRKFAELLVKGEISQETFEEWNRETGSAELPERVRASAKKQATPKKRQSAGKTKAKRKTARKRTTK